MLLALATSCAVLPGEGWRGPLGTQLPQLPHAGSGVIVGNGGHILTHESVIAGARNIVVESCLQERRNRHVASVVRRDPRTGLVMLRADGVSDWVLPWRTSDVGADMRVTALGWPFLGAADPNAHEVEFSSCTGTLVGNTLSCPLAAGYEGGPVVDVSGDGVGIVARTGVAGNGAAHARIVPWSQIADFMRSCGVTPREPVGRLPRGWRARLAQLQNSTVQIERLPRRTAADIMPRLVWRTGLPVEGISGVDFTGPVIVDTWSSSAGRQIWRLDRDTGRKLATSRDSASWQDPGLKGQRRIRTTAGIYELDPSGHLLFSDGRTSTDLTLLNGLRRFAVGGACEVSRDGRLLLVGDAMVWTASNTVLWRLALRPGEPIRMLPDGRAVVIGRTFGEARNSVELWRLPLRRAGTPGLRDN